MSETLTPSGLQSSAGLYGNCGVYQFDRNGAIFNPLDLNPYLLFDAETSMIGTLENPTLDLDPTKQETLDVITATRAGSSTFVNISGEIETAAANTVRVDHSLGYPAILIEPTAVNLIPYSEDFSQSFWTKNNITLSSGFTAPDGSMNASKLVATSDNGSISNVFTVASGTTYSLSFYLKTISGSLETTIGLGSPGFPQNVGDGGRYKNITVTDEWQRFTLTSTADASADTGVSFGGFNGFSTGEELYIWGAQLETGVATSLIPTSGGNAAARTRAADDLAITGSAFSSFYNGAEGTCYLEAIDRDPTSGTHSFLRGQSEHRDFLFKYNGTSIHSFDGSTGMSQSGVAANQLFRASVSYKSGSRTLSLNGTSPEDGSLNTSWSTADRLRIGNGNAVVANMHVKRVIFWPYHKDNL